MTHLVRSFLAFPAVILVIDSTALKAQQPQWSHNGLEVGTADVIQVVIETLNSEALKLGLNADSLKRMCERRLQGSGVHITNDDKLGAPYLYVSMIVLDPAFVLNLSFRRTVRFDAGGRILQITASVWDTGSVGAHEMDPANVMMAMNQKVEEFLVEFRKSNPGYK